MHLPAAAGECWENITIFFYDQFEKDKISFRARGCGTEKFRVAYFGMIKGLSKV